MKKKLSGENIVHINEETGELICRTYGAVTIEDCEVTEGELKQAEFLSKYEPTFNKGVRFVKLYDCALVELTKRLTKAELVFMMKIIQFVSYDDCILRLNGHGNGKILDLNDISRLIEEDYKNCSKLMNGLLKKGVVGKHMTGCVEKEDIIVKCYTFNPYILNRGTKLNRTILALFENTGWKQLTDK